MRADLVELREELQKGQSDMCTEHQSVIDPTQLHRIEGVHHGFLYQHLYAVGCLLLAPSSGVTEVASELDEDIELSLADSRVYVQVKTRAGQLHWNDIEGSLNLFDQLRADHNYGKRLGEAQFIIVSNAEPGTRLTDRVSKDDWPKDVVLLWPECGTPAPDYLPAVWSDSREGLEWCSNKAKEIPLSRLDERTLVLKLAALVQTASAGAKALARHTFAVADLPALFEQLVIQLQDFPEPPKPYYAHTDEPGLETGRHVRLIVGISGSGKTAWASQASVHSEREVGYFDVKDTHSEALLPSLGRELAARLLTNAERGLDAVLVPGIVGLDLLRAIDHELDQQGRQALVVLDNVHGLPAERVAAVVEATQNVDWVLLAQPGDCAEELRTRLGIEAEFLAGWSPDVVAEYCEGQVAKVDRATCEKIIRLTGGLPLYVRQVVSLAKSHYGSRIVELCDAVDASEHTTRTPQEILLSKTLDGLSSPAHDSAILLSLSDVPLKPDEAACLVAESLGISRESAFATIRELPHNGVLLRLQSGELTMHEAFRVSARASLSTLSTEVANKALRGLKEMIERSLAEHHSLDRRRFYLGLLPRVGEAKHLLDLASNDSEMFAELGFAAESRRHIQAVAESDEADPTDRFWALDTLAHWSCQEGDDSIFVAYVKQMRGNIVCFDAGDRERLALHMKEMFVGLHQGDVASVLRHYEEATRLAGGGSEVLPILDYNLAVILFSLGRYADAVRMAEGIALHYYDVLDLDPLYDVFTRNPPEIWAKIGPSSTAQADLKRLADSLDLLARAKNKLGEPAGLARIHAFKFYTMSWAVTSAIKVGQDFVDECLSVSADPGDACGFMESTLLPTVVDLKLAGHVIPVRAQYAVVLAYCGCFDEALEEMSRLQKYAASDSVREEELKNQHRLICSIISGETELPQRKVSALDRAQREVPRAKIGRNDKCPCGSGKKYKRCCGS